MQVLKFGGTSVANSQNMSRVVDIVSRTVENDRTILVCSAISKCTDTLIEVGHKAAARDESYTALIDLLQEKHYAIVSELLPVERQKGALEVLDGQLSSLRSIAQGVFLLGELSRTSLEAIEAFGELMSTRIIATKLASLGIPTKWIDSRNIIRTEYISGKNVVETAATNANIRRVVEENPVTSLFVLPGFIASDAEGRTTTLGRGGSDYSASLFAVGLKARRIEIWTDVSGMMTANPAVVPTARTIDHISYRAALELSHFGAKVIYPPTIQPVVNEGIPIYVKNTFAPTDAGTLIEQNPPSSKSGIIGISNSDDIALLSLEGSGMVGIPGFSSRLFDTFTREDINIILITQASSVHTMCIAVSTKDAEKAKAAADRCFAYEISLGKLNPLKIETGFSIVCLVGQNVFRQNGVTSKMLAALARVSIPIRATAQGSSERNISVIVPSSRVDDAIREIHDEFFDMRASRTTNIFIAGYGTVGKALVDIIAKNSAKIEARTGKIMKICGISNSRRFVIDTDGIDPTKIGELLPNGSSAASDAFFEALSGLSMGNSVFVDCTASADIAYKYTTLFRHGYSVVASNKIMFSAPYRQYSAMKQAAVEYGVNVKYETTVGAALPILESIARSQNSGDEVHSVQAVLSGTLNYIFSTYKGGEDGVTFAEVVRKAQDAGYTEPDPRLDLSGKDVLRKLLILSREAGVPLEEKDVKISPILGPEYFEGDIDSFYEKLTKNEAVFAARYEEAAAKGLRQRFIAILRKSETSCAASIGLESIGPENAIFNLMGTDNSAIIETDFYPSPLVIQGAGAGAYQTASGALNDILKL